MHGLYDSSSPYNIFIYFRTFFVVHLLFSTLFSFSPIYKEKKPLSPPLVAKGCLGGVGEQSFLEQKDLGLENIFLQSPSQNKKHFFTN
jgi:hypothetical protein